MSMKKLGKKGGFNEGTLVAFACACNCNLCLCTSCREHPKVCVNLQTDVR